MSLRQSGPHDRSGLETGLLRGVVKAAGKFQATRSQGAHIDFRREQFETAIKYSGDGTGTFELTDRKFNKNFKLGLTQIGEGEPKQLATSEHTLLLKVRAYLSEQRAPEITVKDFLDVSGTTLKVRSEFIEILRGQVDQKRNPGDHLHANAAESKLKALRIVLDTVLGDTEIAEPEGDGDLDDEMSVDSDRSRSTTSAPPMLSFDVVEKVREKPGRRDPQLEAAQKRLIQEGVSTVPIQSGSDDGTLHHGRVGGVTLGAAGLLAVFQHGSSSAHSSVQGSPLSTGRRSDDSPLLSRAGFGEDEEDDDSVEGGFAITPAQQILFDATGVVEAMRPDDVSFTQTVRNIKGIIDNASIANPEKNRQILAQLPNGDDWTNAKTPVEFFTEAFENNFSGALIPRVYDSPRSRRSSSSSSDSDVSLPPFRGLQIVEFDDIPEEVKALRPEVLDAISEAELKTKWGEEYDTQRNKFSTYEGFRTSVAGVLNVDRVLQERGPELEEATFEVPDMENVTLANIDDMEESVLQGYWGDGYEDAKAQCEGDVGVLKEAVKDALRERQARSVMPARGRSMIPNGTRIPIHEDEEGALVLSTNPGMKNVTVRNIEAMAESKLKGYWGNGFEAARDEWGGLVLFKAEIKRQLEEKVAQKARKKAKRNAGAKVTLQEQPVTERSGVNVEATSGDIPIKQGGRAKVRAWFSWGSSKTQPAQSWQETLKDKIVKTKYAEDVTDKDKATILGDLGLAGNTLFESISEVDLKAEIIKAQGDLGPSRVAFQDSPGISPRVRAPLIEIGDHGITYTEAFTTKLKAGEVSRVALKDCDNPALMAALDIDADTLAALRKVDGDEAPELNNNNIVKRLFDGFFDDQIGLKSEEIKAVIGSGDAPGDIIKRLQTRIATQVNTGHSSGSLSGRKVPTPRPNGLPPQGPPVVLSDGFTMTVKEVEDADIDELRAAWDGSKKSGDWDKLLNRYGQNLANLKRELIRQIQRKNDGGVSSRIVSGPPSGRPPQSGRSHLRRLPSARRTSVHGSTATEGIRKQPTAFSLPTGFNLTAGQVVAKTKDELAEALGKDVPEVDSLIREYGGRDPFIEKVKALIVEGSAEMSSEKMEFSFEDMINPGFIAAQKARMQELSSKAQEDKTTDKSTRAEARLDAATEALVRQFAEEDRLARESASGGSERSSRPMTFAQSAQVSLDEIIGALAESGKLHGSALDVVVDTIYTEVGAAEAAVKLQQEEMVGASAKDRKQFEEINSFVKNSTEAAALAAKLLVKDTAFASRNFGWVANVTKAPRSGIPNSGQSCVTASAIHMMLGVLGGLDSEESSHLSKFVTGDFVTRKAGEPTDRFFKRQRLHQLFVMLMADVHDPAKSPADRQGVQFAFDIALMDYMASYNDELRVIPPSEVRELSPVVSSNSATYFRCLAHVFGLEDDFGHTTRVIVNPGAASMGYAVETSVLTELERVAADWKASDAMKAKLEFQSAMFAQGEAPSKYALVHCTTTQNPSDFQAPDQIFDKFAVQVCHPETGEIVGWRTYTPQLEAVIYRRPTGIAHFVSHCQEGEGGARRAVVYDDSKLIDLRADRARGVSSESVAAERLASIQAFKKDFYPETCVYKVQDIPLPEEDGDMSALAGYELITNDSYPECTKKVGTSS